MLYLSVIGSTSTCILVEAKWRMYRPIREQQKILEFYIWFTCKKQNGGRIGQLQHSIKKLLLLLLFCGCSTHPPFCFSFTSTKKQTIKCMQTEKDCFRTCATTKHTRIDDKLKVIFFQSSGKIAAEEYLSLQWTRFSPVAHSATEWSINLIKTIESEKSMTFNEVAAHSFVFFALEALLSTPVRPPDFGNVFGPGVDGVVIDTDEIVPQDTGHYDYGVPAPKAQVHHTLNTLNTINPVLLRKTSIKILSS